MLTKVKFEIMNSTTDCVALNDTVWCGQNGSITGLSTATSLCMPQA
jgi:hypothetical protein